MKIVTCFLLAWSILCGANESVSQSEFDQLSNYITDVWEGDEEDIWLRIKIGKGLELIDEYSTNQTGNGQNVELQLKPVLPESVFFITGDEIEEIRLTVMLNNTDRSSWLDYEKKMEFISTKMNTKGEKIRLYDTYKFTGSLKNPRLDLRSEPSLFSINDENDEFVIVFKNLLPPSKKSRNR